MYTLNEDITCKELIDYGFTNFNKPYLYFMRMLQPGISFNITIRKKDLGKLQIDVLDENYLQPFHFEEIQTSFAKSVKEAYEELMADLVSDGILLKT